MKSKASDQDRIELVLEVEPIKSENLAPEHRASPDLDTYRQRCELLVAWPIERVEDDWPDAAWSIASRWPAGVFLTEFIDYLSPDLARRESACRKRQKDRWWMYEQIRPIKLDKDSENLGEISERLKSDILRLRYYSEFGHGGPRKPPETETAALQEFYAPTQGDLERWDARVRRQLYGLIRDVILEKTDPGGEFELKYLPRDKHSDWCPLSPGWREALMYLDWSKTEVFNPSKSMLAIEGDEFEFRIFRAYLPDMKAEKKKRADNRGGRPPKYDWGFHIEITRIALIEGEFPDRLVMHRHMLQWCAKNWPEQPEESEIRRRLQRLYETRGILP